MEFTGVGRVVAIPSFIQGISTEDGGMGEGKECMDSRNPFLYSGHFNWTPLRRVGSNNMGVAIPSFIQGISTGGYYVTKL